MSPTGTRSFFSYHMPNFTFPGVPDSELFDHVVLLAQAAEAVGFDHPADILRTVSVPVVLVDSDADKAALAAQMPPTVRQQVVPATVAEGVDTLGRYLDAGFGGFVFRNLTTRTPEAIARAGELIKQLRPQGGPA